MSPLSPTVASWELVLWLRERREQLGVEVKEITQALGFSRNYWSAVENERKILSEESLVKLFDVLEFEPAEQQELLELRDAAKRRGWWSRYPGLFPADIQRLFGLEYGAHGIRNYESVLIPGLLQTADYARAIITPNVTVRQVEVDQRVEARLRRQERLRDEEPLYLTAVISEAALRQQIGGPAVLRRQLDHLIRTVDELSDTVQLRVIPFTATACSLFGAATIYLIDFDNIRLPMVAWQETVTSWGVVDNPTQVRDIATTFDEAFRQRALDREDSLKVIHQRAKELA